MSFLYRFEISLPQDIGQYREMYKINFLKTRVLIKPKLYMKMMNNHRMVPYKVFIFYVGVKSKMVTTTGPFSE